jgi:uracil-DNA glycosylase
MDTYAMNTHIMNTENFASYEHPAHKHLESMCSVPGFLASEQQTQEHSISDDWAKALRPVSKDIAKMRDFLLEEVRSGRGYLPDANAVFRAFQEPLSDIKVLITGQDPYPNPTHPMGLSFSVKPEVHPLPQSLQNIYKELESDLGVNPPKTGDLSAWASQGVMLMNRILTVSPGKPLSHKGKGWEVITDSAINAIVSRKDGTGKTKPLVIILWGAEARSLKRLIPASDRILIIESAHPSPLSANRGFFGSKPFSRTNAFLLSHGVGEVKWV